MLFKSDLKLIKPIQLPDNIDVRKLPQLFRSDEKFIRSLNSPTLSYLIDSLPNHPEYKYLSTDSRTHMLFKDVYPNIPGWHCDDFYRKPDFRNQPALDVLESEANCIHYILLIGDSSLTEFATEDLELPTAKEVLKHNHEKPLYFYYDELIEKINPPTEFLKERNLYSFGPLCFHRGQAATKNGWRYFIRFTFSNHYEPHNELRYQTQVYTRDRVSW